MVQYVYRNHRPQLGDKVFIAPTADVIGRVFLGDNVNIWFKTVIRGDVNQIRIGADTNVQDLSMLHVTKDHELIIGSGVSIGHSVTIHGANIGNHCLIGMGAVILDGAVIGNHCVVAAGTLVPPGKKYPDGSFIIGNPALLKRSLTSEEKILYGDHYKSYLIYKDEYLDANLFHHL